MEHRTKKEKKEMHTDNMSSGDWAALRVKRCLCERERGIRPGFKFMQTRRERSGMSKHTNVAVLTTQKVTDPRAFRQRERERERRPGPLRNTRKPFCTSASLWKLNKRTLSIREYVALQINTEHSAWTQTPCSTASSITLRGAAIM